MDGFVEFLLERIAEDQARFAVEDWEHEWVASPDSTAGAGDDAYIIDLHERLLAECEAKRGIVEAYREERARRDAYQASSAELRRSGAQLRRSSAARCRGLEIAVQLLAEVYADHSDYDPAWRP